MCTENETDCREKENDGLDPRSWLLIPNHIADYGSRVEYLIIRSSISSSPSSPWIRDEKSFFVAIFKLGWDHARFNTRTPLTEIQFKCSNPSIEYFDLLFSPLFSFSFTLHDPKFQLGSKNEFKNLNKKKWNKIRND